MKKKLFIQGFGGGNETFEGLSNIGHKHTCIHYHSRPFLFMGQKAREVHQFLAFYHGVYEVRYGLAFLLSDIV